MFGEIFEHVDGLDDHGGPGFFSTRVIAVFVTAFGGAGAVATYYGAAADSGVGRRERQPASSSAERSICSRDSCTASRRAPRCAPTTSSARLHASSSRFPPAASGQIRCRVGEELVDKIARTRDGDPLAENVSVQVEEVLGETVIVKKH